MEVTNHTGNPGDQHYPYCPHAPTCPHCGAPKSNYPDWTYRPYPYYPWIQPWYPYTVTNDTFTVSSGNTWR